jgi:hypothetical protein
VPRDHVIQLTFDDGVTRELEFLTGSNQGTVFAPLDDPPYFAPVKVDPESRTVAWPNGLDLDPAVLHGDFEPPADPIFAISVLGPTGARRAPSSHTQIQSCGWQPKFGGSHLAYKISINSRPNVGWLQQEVPGQSDSC